MKPFIFLPFALIALFSVNAKASIDSNIKKFCIPIKKEMCKAGDCSKINQVVEMAFLNCIASHTELKLINKNTDLSKVEPKTKAGFNLVFGHMLGKIGADIKNGNPNANYAKLKNEYAHIKFKYDTYQKKDGDQLVNLAKKLPQKYEILKYSILREQEDDQENLTRYIKKFEFMLKSETDFPKYKATYIKFLPDVYVESNYPKFEFKKFSFYECSFLALMTEIKELQETLGFDCAKN